MRLFAISDLHLHYPENRDALLASPAYPQDCLALVGDIGETEDHLRFAFEFLATRFKKLIWVPGNHELWTTQDDQSQIRGVEKYNACVDLARSYNVLTPEDPYLPLEFDGKSYYICPLFTLYDYTFCPLQLTADQALDWAQEAGIRCMDELRMSPQPYSSIVDWCHARCEISERRLMRLNGARTILINHYPLRHDLVVLPRIPRFSIWCGTVRTTDWHIRFNAALVLSGHLHVPSTQYRDNVRFEEVSLGYPREWTNIANIHSRMRQVLPQAVLGRTLPTNPNISPGRS
jgi:3',5'-cyclic AMP phosphodiesterase CpdA